ncbi:transcription termination/antitermination protein NusG [Salisaeta longa]|uniref:transcription termination/antitermination protein NusG n=1 Tax=Salisaeta longa TaxID=503170 RepID=UPI0003B40353|nr:transcription termination/antitermination protein NusG [Salisaeta longa]
MANGIKKWYVLRTFSGHEKKVRRYMESELERLDLEDRVDEIMIPTETVFEMRGGKKRTKERKFFPGYILLHCTLDTYLRELAEGLPSVIGFLKSGTGKEPTPLRPDEVQRILGKMDRAEAMGEQPEIPFKPGDPVKVVDGPFDSFNGFVEEVYPEKMKVKVMVSIFGRKTPVELDYLQVEHEE